MKHLEYCAQQLHSTAGSECAAGCHLHWPLVLHSSRQWRCQSRGSSLQEVCSAEKGHVELTLPACSYEVCTEEPSRASSAISGVLYQAPSPPSHTASASSSHRHSPDQERARLLSSKVRCALSYCCSCQGVHGITAACIQRVWWVVTSVRHRCDGH